MAGQVITYPWARPQGYNPKLKLKKRKKENNKQATSERPETDTIKK